MLPLCREGGCGRCCRHQGLKRPAQETPALLHAPFPSGCWNDSLGRVVFSRGMRPWLMVPRWAPSDLITTAWVHLGSDVPQSLQTQEDPDQNHLLTPHSTQSALPHPFPAAGKVIHPTVVCLPSSASDVAVQPSRSSVRVSPASLCGTLVCSLLSLHQPSQFLPLDSAPQPCPRQWRELTHHCPASAWPPFQASSWRSAVDGT